MHYRHLGTSGLVVSELGLGCNNLGGRVNAERSVRLVHCAYDAGITFFDVANVYGRRGGYAGASEEALGVALKGRRHNAVIATKFGMKMTSDPDPMGAYSGASRRAIFRAIDESLRRLQTDWIDLYQLHQEDPETPIEETLRTLDDLVRAGKIRYAGVSNLPAWKVVDAWHVAHRHGYAGLISCQDNFSILNREATSSLLPMLKKFGLGLLPYFPLANGVLTGKYSRNERPPPETRLGAWQDMRHLYRDPKIWSLVERLNTFSQRHQRKLTELAFGWLLHHSAVGSVIAGATSEDQILENVASVACPLTPEELKGVDVILEAAAHDEDV